MPFNVGQIISNRYRIVKLLGQGGFGVVYKVWDINLNQPWALKENTEVSPGSQQQFLREAKILAGLTHLNLARVVDYFSLPTSEQCLVMDFVEGENLQEKLDKTGVPFPEVELISWIEQICDVLDYLHAQNPPVIHRDIKPANIRITPQGRAVLVDFGIAKAYTPGKQTTAGARAATPGFSPPEQYLMIGATDARSDVYALGATVYALLTGRVPPESVARTGGNSLPLIRDLNPAVSRTVETAVDRAMRLDAGQRFQTAAEFKAALLTKPGPVPPIPTQTIAPASPSPKNWPAILMGIGLACLVSLICIGIGAFAFYQATLSPTPTLIRLTSTITRIESPTAIEIPDNSPIPTVAPGETLPPAPSLSHRIAYAKGGEQSGKRSIFIKNLDDPNSDTRITSGTDQFGDNFPIFSPDGNSLAFSRCFLKRSDGCELFVKSLNAGTPKKVLSGHKVMRPKWCGSTSSDYHDWVVFEDRGKNGNDYVDAISSLGLVNTTTGEFKKLTPGPSDWSANWSSDCSQIAFTRYDKNETAGLYADLMLLDLKTGDVTPLIGTGDFSSPAELSPAWSPDGAWIAYRKADDTTGDGIYSPSRDRADLWLIRPDGSNNHPIIANSYNIASIAWSPDSQSIVFATQDYGMFVCDLQGQIISDFGKNYLHPDWAP